MAFPPEEYDKNNICLKVLLPRSVI